jgi:hypothetical protein
MSRRPDTARQNRNQELPGVFNIDEQDVQDKHG